MRMCNVVITGICMNNDQNTRGSRNFITTINLQLLLIASEIYKTQT